MTTGVGEARGTGTVARAADNGGAGGGVGGMGLAIAAHDLPASIRAS